MAWSHSTVRHSRSDGKPGHLQLWFIRAPYSRHPAATVETSPLLIGDTIYFGASDGIIYGIDKESGQTTWKHKTGAPLFSTLSTNGNMIFATDFGGNVYAFKCNE